METTLRGIGISPGIGIGPALVFDVSRFEVPHYAIQEAGPELQRLEKAIEETRHDLTQLYRQTAAELGQTHADIFNAHLVLLDDVAVRGEVTQRVESLEANVEYILQDLTQRYTKIMESIEDPRFRERTADLLDVVDRVMRHLLDAKRPDLTDLPRPSAVVAHELSPSDTAGMNVEQVVGVAMDLGSATSHAAILARALEIPAVMGLERASTQTEPGAMLVVDGGQGLVIVHPSEKTLAYYRSEQERQAGERRALQKAAKSGPCVTCDGIEIATQANIELPVEIAHCLEAHAQGIGLYRTEYLFLNRDTLPSEEEQYQSYSHAAKAMDPFPVTLRTMDIGGDKFVSHLSICEEANPQLGWRAVRFCLARPDIFKTQLRAMLRASVHGNVEIMFPMISGLEELRKVKAVLEEVKAELDSAGTDFDHAIRVGSMIEVPSAVAITKLLAKECDFFSVGTNDLIQYSLAVDRVNEKIAHLYEPAHPAVLRMIGWSAKGAAEAGISCRICGEMAGDPFFTELLVGLGVTSLSMSAIALPGVRATLRHLHVGEAQALAARALALGTSAEVRALLAGRLKLLVEKQPELSMLQSDQQGERTYGE